ncbi:MAG: hypothetical protein ACP5OG_02340 [Candidatus Nanoarchaeia archaeon]
MAEITLLIILFSSAIVSIIIFITLGYWCMIKEIKLKNRKKIKELLHLGKLMQEYSSHHEIIKELGLNIDLTKDILSSTIEGIKSSQEYEEYEKELNKIIHFRDLAASFGILSIICFVPAMLLLMKY